MRTLVRDTLEPAVGNRVPRVSVALVVGGGGGGQSIGRMAFVETT